MHLKWFFKAQAGVYTFKNRWGEISLSHTGQSPSFLWVYRYILTETKQMRSVVMGCKKLFTRLKTLWQMKSYNDMFISPLLNLYWRSVSYLGGASKSTLLELERAQRAVLKVTIFLPFRYPISLLHKKAKVVTVRQLFIKQIILIQLSKLVYNPFLFRGRWNK